VNINTEALEFSPTVSADERTIIFVRNVGDGVSSGDLWEATRTHRGEPFGEPRLLVELDNGSEGYGSLSADGLTLFFAGIPHAGHYLLSMVHRTSRFDAEGNPMPWDRESERLVPGCPNQVWSVNGAPVISPRWPAEDSRLYWAIYDPPDLKNFSLDIYVARWQTVPFKRGDANGDGKDLDVSDAVYILQNLFAGGAAITCSDAADANDDGAVNLADGVYILQNLFARGPELPLPYSDCGFDPTRDNLGCLEYEHCP
jgi:hypothetical protein